MQYDHRKRMFLGGGKETTVNFIVVGTDDPNGVAGFKQIKSFVESLRATSGEKLMVMAMVKKGSPLISVSWLTALKFCKREDDRG